LQLLFAEYQWPHGFHVLINGRTAVREFAPFQWQGALPAPRTNAVVITHTFVAPGAEATVVLDGRLVTDPRLSDHNSIIQGATLEVLARRVTPMATGCRMRGRPRSLAISARRRPATPTATA